MFHLRKKFSSPQSALNDNRAARTRKGPHRYRCLMALPVAAVASLLSTNAHVHAVDIFATGQSQNFGQDWNQATWNGGLGQWSDGLAPSAGKTYATGALAIRTTNAASSTFGGDSLRVTTGGVLSLKQGYTRTATVNLILDGGSLFAGDGTTGGDLLFVAGNVDVASNSIIGLNDSNRRRISMRNGNFTGSGNVTINGGNDVNDLIQLEATLIGSHTGNWIVNGGRLVVNRDDHIGNLASVNLNGAQTFLDFRSDQTIGSLEGSGQVTTLTGGSRTLTVGGNNASTTFSGTIVDGSGTVGLTKEGTGNLTLTGNNSYSGETTVNAGTLTITNSNALGATGAASDTHIVGANGATGTTLVLSGAALTINETLNFNANASGRSGLTNNNTFNQTLNGPIDVSSTGTLVQWSSSGSGSITVNGDITGNMSGNSLLFLRGGSTSVNNRILGSINLTGGNLAKTDDGLWVIGNAGETYSWNNTQVARGTLRLNLANMLPSATLVSVGQGTDPAAATLDLNGFSQTIAGLTKAGNGTNKQVTNTSATAAVLTINNAANNTYAGRINGNLGLTKSGAGTLTLTDANGYTGDTIISQGVLALTGSGAIDNSPVINIAAGATFNVSGVSNYNLTSTQSIIGNGSIVGDVVTDAGSLLSPGLSIGTLSFGNNLDINGNVLIEVDPAAVGQKIDIINVAGILDVTGANLQFAFLSAPIDGVYVFADYGSLIGEFASVSGLPSGYELKYSFNGTSQIALVSIPEPATMSLLALGSLAMLRRRRVVG